MTSLGSAVCMACTPVKVSWEKVLSRPMLKRKKVGMEESVSDMMD